MHSVPRRPARGNWIWLAAGAVAVTVLGGAAFHFASGRVCPPPAAGASPSPRAGGHGPLPGPAQAAAASTAAGPGSNRTPGPVTSGLAVYYYPAKAVGSCSLGPFPAGGLYVSLPPQRYAGGAACGSYLDVHGPGGSVRVEVVDLCPGCSATTINLSRAAFGRIGNPVPGSAPVTYRQAQDPPLPGPVEVRVGTTGTAAKLALQILHHGNPLTSVAIAPSTGAAGTGAAVSWHRLTLAHNDFWVSGTRPSGRVNVRIIDNLGHQVVLRKVSLRPGSTIRSAVWMYRASTPAPPAPSAAAGPPASQSSPSRAPTASPSASATGGSC